MIEEIFKLYSPATEKLIAFGFKQNGNVFYYESKLQNCNFLLKFSVNLQNDIKTQLIDTDSGEEYVLHLSSAATGKFVGIVREDFENELIKIRNACFEKQIFKTQQAKQIINYIAQKYGRNLEFLWPKFPTDAIVRRADNNKWFALFMDVQSTKIKNLNMPEEKMLEVLNVRISPQNKNNIVNNTTIFEGYHMNKNSWISIIFDYGLSISEIKKLVDSSFNIVAK